MGIEWEQNGNRMGIVWEQYGNRMGLVWEQQWTGDGNGRFQWVFGQQEQDETGMGMEWEYFRLYAFGSFFLFTENLTISLLHLSQF